MFWSAVSFCSVLLTGGSLEQLAKRDANTWARVKDSVVTLLREGIPFGQAALIDKSGLFLAHQSVVVTATTKAQTSSGKTILLVWKATDPSTQTVLLQAEKWDSPAAAVSLDGDQPSPAKPGVLVVLPGGPVTGELVANDRLAVLANKRMFALGEIRFEATAQNVGGALVFDDQGHLVGLLNATLGAGEATPRFAQPQKDVAQNFIQKSLQSKGFGPGQAMVGYTVQNDVLKRVVAGFLSTDRKVKHPAIGIVCKDAPGQGALVMSIRDGSPAAKAGLQPYDIIVKMDDADINTQFDFAKFIDTKNVGDSVKVTVIRNLVRSTINVTVGVYQN